MTCSHCFQDAPDGSAFCPQCGARLAAPDTVTALEVAQEPAYGPLAQANLLRLRGEWEAARQKVVDVLRELPNSATAHSLMGDICADQGLDEEAAQWYRMALDLEPENAADARKLRAAESRRGIPLPLEDLDIPETRPPVSVFRLAAVTSVLLLAGLIAIPLWYHQTYQPPAPGALVPAVRPATVRAPSVSQPPRADEPAAAPAASAAPAHQIPTAESGRESALRAELADEAGSMGAVGVRLAGVQVDPRDSAATITMDGSGVDGSASDWTVKVSQAALSACKRALKVDAGLLKVTVRVVMPLAGPKTVVSDVAFVGEIARDHSAFDREWWHPGLTVPSEARGTAS